VRFARLRVVGAANTAAGYAIYLALLVVVDYRVAYTLAYVAGLVGGYLAQARWVFGVRPGARSAVAYLATYAAMYVVALAAVVDKLGVPKPFGMLAALAVTVPASYALLRRGYGGRTAGERRER